MTRHNYWLYSGGQPLTGICAPAHTPPAAIIQLALRQHDRIPTLGDPADGLPYMRRQRILHAEVRAFPQEQSPWSQP